MGYNFLQNVNYCAEYVSEFREFLLYSHLVPAIFSLLLGGYVFYRARNQLSKYLLIISCTFFFWVLTNLLIWFTYDKPSLLMYAWSLIEIFSSVLFLFTFLFFYRYISQTDLPPYQKILLFLPILPIILFSANGFLIGYNPQECVALENPTYSYYVDLVNLSYAILTVVVLGYRIVSGQYRGKRREIIILSLGLLTFLYAFFASTYIADFTGDFRYETAGLMSFSIFIGALAYLITNYQSFEFKLIGARVLIFSLVILSVSQIAFFTTVAGRIVDVLTATLVTIFSYFLLKSFKRERIQREQIQKLADSLETANVRLERLDKLKSEFVSIASHQLRSPLTTMMGYASMLRDGSYGKLPAKALEAASRIEESSRFMAASVEDYLNVSRIEAGHMKYNLTDFSLHEQAEHITDDIRPIALKQGIVLLYRSKLDSKGTIHADKGKTEQILHNLINNALKYTQKGTITVVLHDDVPNKKLTLDIIDTGIGMSPETQRNIFQKFERGSNANTTNTNGTGLGLYTASKLAEAMGGSITAHSDGEGKGSRFSLVLPLLL